jgi:quercetin 2,3-dioxygenase
MITFRDRMARGQSRSGWLDSRHTFSFAHYQDPAQMGFRSLGHQRGSRHSGRRVPSPRPQ